MFNYNLMNKVLIVDASESDRRLMVGMLVKHSYEPIAVETMEVAKDEVAKLPPGAVIVAAMKFVRGTAQELINWQKAEGYGFPVIAIVDNLNALDIADVMKDGGAVNIIQRTAMDKQLVETVGRYARPGRTMLLLPDELIPRRSEAFAVIERAIRNCRDGRQCRHFRRMRLRKRADCKRDLQAQFTVTKALHRHRSRRRGTCRQP